MAFSNCWVVAVMDSKASVDINNNIYIKILIFIILNRKGKQCAANT